MICLNVKLNKPKASMAKK